MAIPDLAIAEDLRAPHVTSPLAERVGRRYLLYLLFLPLLGYVFPFVAERAPVLERFSVSRWGQMLDYAHTLKGTNADVLIFGDSSADYNEDTVRLSNDLGLKVINIPNNQGSLPVLQDQMLRRYLRENRPPRLIVFHFCAWDMNFKTTKNRFMYDGLEQVVRHGTMRDLLEVLHSYPSDLLLFPFRFYRSPNRISNFLMLKRLPEVKMVQGHTAFPNMPSLKQGCTIPNSLLAQTQTRSVQELVRDFGTPQTKVLVYLPPLPNRTNAESTAMQQHEGIVAAPATILPPDLFADDSFYTHALPVGVDKTTLALEEKIQLALGQSQRQ